MRLPWPFSRPADDGPAAGGGPRLLVATFGRLLWWFPATGRHRVVQEGRGKYYGMSPAGSGYARNGRLLVVSRPDQESDDRLLLLDHRVGRTRRRIRLVTRDTHGTARDGRLLYVTDTFRGRVVAYDVDRLEPVRTYEAFTHENHVNTVHVEGERLFALCHNKGPSFLSVLDVESGRELHRYDDAGEHSHDIVPWQDALLVCDSRGGALIAIDRDSGRRTTLWADEGHFSKGLTVAGDRAWFGISKAATRAERVAVECDLVEFDLVRGEQVSRRRVPSRGLVNAITTDERLRAAAS